MPRRVEVRHRRLQSRAIARGLPLDTFFSRKPRSSRAEVVRRPWSSPMIAMHLSAMAIQSVVRMFLIRSAASKGTDHLKAYRDAQETKNTGDVCEPLSVQYMKIMGTSKFGKEYYEWLATRIQAWYRMVFARMRYKYGRFQVYTVAALQIQNAWRKHHRER